MCVFKEEGGTEREKKKKAKMNLGSRQESAGDVREWKESAVRKGEGRRSDREGRSTRGEFYPTKLSEGFGWDKQAGGRCIK